MTALTTLGLFGAATSATPAILPKPQGGNAAQAIRVPDFDIWRAGYAGTLVQVTDAGTGTPAPLYYDVDLTIPAQNPQELIAQRDDNGQTYGKWAQPVYTFVPYYLLINATETTGIVEPSLKTLEAQDASYALAAATRGGFPIPLRTWLDRTIQVSAYGAFGPGIGSLTNTTTLRAAIGAAAAQGGGVVRVPPGTHSVGTFDLAEGVILQGEGPGATVLQCAYSSVVCTIDGDGAGLRDLTLDGVSLNQSSIGVDLTGRAAVVFSNVVLKRFSTGLRAKGLTDSNWSDLSIVNCTFAADIRGDADASGSGVGSAVQNVSWRGGTVALNVGGGLVWQVIDKAVSNLLLENVSFASNVGAGCQALTLRGARNARLVNCNWSANTGNWSVEDGTNASYVALNTSRNVFFDGGVISTGNCNFDGVCADVQVRGVDITGAGIILSLPQATILFVDCFMDAATAIGGDTTKYATLTTSDVGLVTGVTTDGSPITAWQAELKPGQVALVEAKGLAKQRNGVNYGVFWAAAGAFCPGATLTFASGTAAFTVNAILTGQTSGASARISAKTGTASAGTLTLIEMAGTFRSGELITDSAGGSARQSGAVVINSATLDGGGSTDIRSPQVSNTSGYALALDVAGTMMRVRVTGANSHTVAWDVKVDALVN